MLAELLERGAEAREPRLAPRVAGAAVAAHGLADPLAIEPRAQAARRVDLSRGQRRGQLALQHARLLRGQRAIEERSGTVLRLQQGARARGAELRERAEQHPGLREALFDARVQHRPVETEALAARRRAEVMPDARRALLERGARHKGVALVGVRLRGRAAGDLEEYGAPVARLARRILADVHEGQRQVLLVRVPAPIAHDGNAEEEVVVRPEQRAVLQQHAVRGGVQHPRRRGVQRGPERSEGRAGLAQGDVDGGDADLEPQAEERRRAHHAGEGGPEAHAELLPRGQESARREEGAVGPPQERAAQRGLLLGTDLFAPGCRPRSPPLLRAPPEPFVRPIALRIAGDDRHARVLPHAAPLWRRHRIGRPGHGRVRQVLLIDHAARAIDDLGA
mmetsp:Transcript_99711/g.277416  ORF Transcript_99711/g.277416 Transcript_99711/m.277416 type:complete len:393 (-) Transcript_99711:2260-3438(-)